LSHLESRLFSHRPAQLLAAASKGELLFQPRVFRHGIEARSRMLPLGAILRPLAQKIASNGSGEPLQNRAERAEEVLEQLALERNDRFDRARVSLPGANGRNRGIQSK